MASTSLDHASSIEEVKEWLSFKQLDDSISDLIAAGYDDLPSLAACTPSELAELRSLFPTPDSQNAIEELTHALTQLGIDVYRKQKGEFRRLLGLTERQAKQPELAEQVSRVRVESMAVKASNPTVAGAVAVAGASSSAAAASVPGAGIGPGIVTAGTPKSGQQLKLPPPLTGYGAEYLAAATAAAAAAASSANPTLEWDVSTFEGALRFHAYINSSITFARCFDESYMSPAVMQDSLLEGRSPSVLQKVQRMLRTLTEGSSFRKLKRGNATKRLIWTPPQLDFLVWGSEDKSAVKGFIATHEIQEVHRGFGASPEEKRRIYIVSPERTLELEAKDESQLTQWQESLECLVQYNMSELECKSALTAAPGFAGRFERAKNMHTKLLMTGSVFKKSGASSALSGGFTTRLVWTAPAATPDSMPERLQWGDLVTRKVLGFVLLADIVDVREGGEGHPGHKSKLTVIAMKRTLELEARNEATRDRWVRALRFFVEFKNRSPPTTTSKGSANGTS